MALDKKSGQRWEWELARAITIDQEDLRAGSYYWARSHGSGETEIVQVSDIFGSSREYWTVATIGSDQHRSLNDFDFLIRLLKP